MTDSERTIQGDDEIDLNDDDEDTPDFPQKTAELKLHHGSDNEIFTNGGKGSSGPGEDSLTNEKKDQSKPYQIDQGLSQPSASASQLTHSVRNF